MAKQTSYEASVVYASEPISQLDRNVARIAKNYGGSVCGDSFEYSEVRQHRKLAYSFETKAKRRRFLRAMEKFLKTSNFGTEVAISALGDKA